jgi:hypothetical protein
MTPEQRACELAQSIDTEAPRMPMTVWDRFILIAALALSGYMSYLVITNIYKFVSVLFVG